MKKLIELFTRKRSEIRVLDVRDKAVLAAGLGVFILLCATLINLSSVWFDEAFGAYLVRFSYADVAHYTASDVHPPLYYWVLKAWTSVFGTTELGFRSLSVLFACIAIVFAFLLVFKYFGRRAAWTGLLFMIMTPFFVRYSVEARMYTMVAAIALAATFVLTTAERSKKTWQWVLYGVLIGVGMLTHYFIVLVWLAHWVWRAISYSAEGTKGRVLFRRFFSRGWIIAHAIGIVLFAPWIGSLISQFKDVTNNGFWILPITPATPVNFMTNVFLYREQTDTQSWLAVIFGALMVLIVLLVIRVVRGVLTREQTKYYLLVALLAVVPPLLLMLLSLPPLRPSFVDRYVVPSALMVGLFVGISLGLGSLVMRKRLWVTLTLGAVFVFGLGITNVYRIGNYNNTLHESNNTRDVLTRVRTESAPAPVIANSPWLYYEAAFYSSAEYPVKFVDANTEYKYGSLAMLRENDLGKIKNLNDFESANSQFWYIGRPGDGELNPLGANLRVIKSFRIDDTVTGAKAYEAVLYSVE